MLFPRILTSPGLEMPETLRHNTASSLAVPLEPGRNVTIFRHNRTGEAVPVITMQTTSRWRPNHGAYLVNRLDTGDRLQPLPPAIQAPVRHETGSDTLLLGEGNEDHTSKVYLGPSLYGPNLYGFVPAREVTRYDGRYGVIRPVYTAAEGPVHLQITMPEQPYGSLGMITVAYTAQIL